jgi:hypothetical protein
MEICGPLLTETVNAVSGGLDSLGNRDTIECFESTEKVSRR